jgi:nucleotide-binding universal stress UspA family protein
MNTIVVLTDFSTVAHHASLYAIKLARQTQSEIHILHTICTPVDWHTMRRVIDIRHPLVKERLERADAGIIELENLARMEGVAAKGFINYNKEYFDLVDHGKQYHPEYVVMGSHGAKGMKEILHGSNAQRVIRHAPCPTLVIKEMPENIQIKEIAFASFFHEEDLPAFREVVKFAGYIGAHVNLLYVNTPFMYERKDIIERRIQSFLEQVNGTSSSTVSTFVEFGKYSEEGMLDFIKEQPMDLLALTNSAKKGITGSLKHSFAERVVNHIDKPVLTILD